MHKYIYALVAIIVLAVVLIVAQKYLHTGWQHFTDSKLGISFEYPTSEMSPIPEGYVASNNWNNTQAAVGEVKKVGAGIIPTDPSEVNSVDDWVKMISKKIIPSTNLKDPFPNFPNLRYEVIDGQRAAISYFPPDYPTGGISDAETQILVFRNKQLQNITIMNLSQADTERIVRSIKFSKIEAPIGGAHQYLPPLTPEEIQKYGAGK